MKKIIRFLILLLAVLFFISTFISCKAQPSNYDGDWSEISNVIRGTDGKDGVGIASLSINENGELQIYLTNGTQKNLGRITGKKGNDGIGIQNIAINQSGELLVTLTDGTEKNCGIIFQESGTPFFADDTKCYFKIHATGNEEYRIRALYEQTTNSGMQIDWGDGDLTESVAEKEDCQHTYRETGEYLISVTGITALSNLFLRANTSIYWVKLSNQIQSVGNYAFSECENLSDLIFTGPAPVFGEHVGYDSGIEKVMIPVDFAIDYFSNASAELLPYIQTDNNCIYSQKIVTVGDSGDFATISAALKYLSQFYPVYASGGIPCKIKILRGTTISEQIYVKQLDLQFITIIAEDEIVPVICDGWKTTMDAHDARGNKVFIAGEYSAKIPTIGCVFKLVENADQTQTAGLICNRGSEGVILPGCGFDSFYDGVISNNESSITMREGIAINCTRYGAHARHNGEISARSAILTGNGIAASADRVAELDVREAYLDNSTIAIDCQHASTICAAGTHATNCGIAGGDPIISGTYGSMIDCSGMNIDSPQANVYQVACGGQIVDFANVSGAENVKIYSQKINTLTANGVIYAKEKT